MQMTVDLVPLDLEFEAGAQSFLDVLRVLERGPLFEPAWEALSHRLWEDEAGFVSAARQSHEDTTGRPPEKQFGFGALNNPDGEQGAAVELRAGLAQGAGDVLSIDIRGPHPSVPYDAAQFASLCDVLLKWRRVQHISMAWRGYKQELQSVDQARRGLGWLGWVPFHVTPDQLPEAQICRPLAYGTFVATQSAMWFSHGPRADPAAVSRAQALERRMLRLGVLPTVVELRRGDWGV